MKLKALYLSFIVFLSFYSKAQSDELNKPVLANSQSLSIDTLQNNRENNLPKLYIQDSKLDSQTEFLNHQPKLKASEALETKKMKPQIHQEK